MNFNNYWVVPEVIADFTYFRYILLFYFRKRQSAAQAAKKLRDAYGEEAVNDLQCRNCFDKFRSGDFSLKDEQRSGRPNEIDDDQIKAIIESDRDVTVRKIKEMLKIPKLTIVRNIQGGPSNIWNSNRL